MATEPRDQPRTPSATAINESLYDESALQGLFSRFEATFPAETLGKDRWYIVATAALAGSPYPDLVGPLYSYLIEKKDYQTPEQRQRLVRRMREALVKVTSVVGVAKPIEAIMSIAKLEKESDRDYSCSRSDWQTGPSNRERGLTWLQHLYKGDLSPIFASFAAHKDFEWMTTEITYGLYCSDHRILDGMETELVILPGLLIQNLPLQSGWHLRAIRRLGVERGDVELLQQCAEMAGEYTGSPMGRCPRVGDVEHEV